MRHLLVALTLMLCTVGIVSAKDTRMLIDQVPPAAGVFSPQTAIGPDKYPDQQAAFKQAVEKALNGKYQVIAQHIYIYPSDKSPSWAPLRMYIADYMGSHLNGVSYYNNIGYAENIGVEIWKVGTFRPKYFALSMTPCPDGNSLVGYFEVEKQ